MPVYTSPEPITAVVEVSGAQLTVRATDRTDTQVEVRPHNPTSTADTDLAAITTVDFANGWLSVRGGRDAKSRLRAMFGGGARVDVEIDLPAGSALEVRGWGDVVATGTLGRVEVDSGMAEVTLGRVGRLRVKTSMGDIRVAQVDADGDLSTSAGGIQVDVAKAKLTARTSAGDVTVGDADGELILSTSMGEVRVDRADGPVSAKSKAGNVRVGRVRRGRATLESTYGTLEVGVAQGTAAWLEVNARHGQVHSDLQATDGPAPTEETVEIRASAAYGDIILRRA
jgi:DUF4097 and DUF4098 domain-containing protein YvlB